MKAFRFSLIIEKKAVRKFVERKLAYPIYHTCTYTLEEANNFRSVFFNLFSTAFKRQKSLIFNQSYYLNNVECLVVDKAFIFI